jgi:hypothetical protein
MGKAFIVQMIYDGLLTRTKLRERMAERSQFDMGFPSQVQYLACVTLHLVLNERTTIYICSRFRMLLKSDRRGWCLERRLLFLE